MNRFSIWLCRLAGLSLLSLTLAVPAHAVPLANGLDGFRTTPGSSFTLPAALPSAPVATGVASQPGHRAPRSAASSTSGAAARSCSSASASA